MKKLYSHFKSLSFILLVSTGTIQGMEPVPQQQTSNNSIECLVPIASKCIADHIKATGDLTDLDLICQNARDLIAIKLSDVDPDLLLDSIQSYAIFNLVCQDIQDLIATKLLDVSDPDLLLKSIQASYLIPNDIVSKELKFCFLETSLADQVETLNYACTEKDLNSVKIILKATNPSIFMQKFLSMTPLYQAAISGCAEIVKEIIAFSGDNAFNVITAMHHNDMEISTTVLYWPIRNDFAEVIKTILDATGDKAFDLITLNDRMGYSLWFHALNRNNPKIVKIFLDAVGNKTCKLICMCHEGGWTMENSLHNSADITSIEVLTLLIETAGENICEIILLQNRANETVLHKIAKRKVFKEADREKCIEVAELLIAAAGPNAQNLLSIKNDNGYTALDIAIHSQNTKLVEFLKTMQ